MGLGLGIALAVRLSMPLTIPRWPLAGVILSIVADTCDILIFNIWGFPTWDYQHFDKALDLYYISFALLVAQRWPQFERTVASGLFTYRLIGMALFVTTGWRVALFVFPNLFEVYYLLVLGTARFAPGYALTKMRTLAWLGVMLIPKLVQEYLLHYAKVLDDLVLFDVMRDLWP